MIDRYIKKLNSANYSDRYNAMQAIQEIMKSDDYLLVSSADGYDLITQDDLVTLDLDDCDVFGFVGGKMRMLSLSEINALM
jgi:hypothetical protein